MLDISAIMNSPVGEILAFKCCALPDQNLEIHLRNTGDRAVVLSGFFWLESKAGSTKVSNIYPPGDITVPPEDVTAVYCYLDSSEWDRYDTIAFFDLSGRPYRSSTRVGRADGPSCES